MELQRALAALKASIRARKLVRRRHFSEMTRERDLDPAEITSVLQKGRIVGFTHQGEDVYKAVFQFTTEKDLNIVVGIKGKAIRLISLFPSETRRRIKHGT